MDEDTLAELEMKDEAASKEVSIAEKRALAAEAKRRYGKDWGKMFSRFTSGGSGIDWQALKFRL